MLASEQETSTDPKNVKSSAPSTGWELVARLSGLMNELEKLGVLSVDRAWVLEETLPIEPANSKQKPSEEKNVESSTSPTGWAQAIKLSGLMNRAEELGVLSVDRAWMLEKTLPIESAHSKQEPSKEKNVESSTSSTGWAQTITQKRNMSATQGI